LIPFSLVCQQNLSQSDFGDRFLKIILVDKGGRQPGFGIKGIKSRLLSAACSINITLHKTLDL
jgi:hypothetical protein